LAWPVYSVRLCEVNQNGAGAQSFPVYEEGTIFVCRQIMVMETGEVNDGDECFVGTGRGTELLMVPPISPETFPPPIWKEWQGRFVCGDNVEDEFVFSVTQGDWYCYIGGYRLTLP